MTETITTYFNGYFTGPEVFLLGIIAAGLFIHSLVELARTRR